MPSSKALDMLLNSSASNYWPPLVEAEAEPKITEQIKAGLTPKACRPNDGQTAPSRPLASAPLTWPCCPPAPLTLTLAARVSSLSMSRSSSTSISSSGISSSWGGGGGGGRDKGLSWERGCERGSG